MKKRIKVDSSLLSVVIIVTGCLYFFQDLYPKNFWVNCVLDFIGMLFVLKGNLLRMASRGHKKKHSQKSSSLVTTGPYALVRNPMYLGSFLIGAGFILIIWPWWALPLFAILFYIRFRVQVDKEEVFLKENFKDTYTDYCAKTPRIFPSLKGLFTGKVRAIFNLDEAFSTKEARGLIAWPVLALIFGIVQGYLIYGQTNIQPTLFVHVIAVIVFTAAFLTLYQKE